MGMIAPNQRVSSRAQDPRWGLERISCGNSAGCQGGGTVHAKYSSIADAEAKLSNWASQSLSRPYLLSLFLGPSTLLAAQYFPGPREFLTTPVPRPFAQARRHSAPPSSSLAGRRRLGHREPQRIPDPASVSRGPRSRGAARNMGWKAAEKLIRHWKILRGDNVMIIRGKDKGESGLIKRVIRSQNRVIVEGKNLVKKHIKQGEGHTGGIFSIEAPLHVSNVQVVDPVTGKPCKVGYKMGPKSAGPKDTPIEHVLEKTYDEKAGIGMPDL
ncbi:hypothetical protein PR202_ga04085 [Eleusine coracana subsp. coracana]|uniref:KOW domain-containing protein n=1 Tax=Eleusine coracana subsp. coracana TaxID=191504 RepID=A0AAV5BP46_ELECO|nr:hypothetical protein PR202_ga04085 [Eleusine coracana subsp. coracana]